MAPYPTSPICFPPEGQALLLIHQFYPARTSVSSPPKSAPNHDTSSRKPSWPGCLLYSAPSPRACPTPPASTQRAGSPGLLCVRTWGCTFNIGRKNAIPSKGLTHGQGGCQGCGPHYGNAGNHKEAGVLVSPQPRLLWL